MAAAADGEAEAPAGAVRGAGSDERRGPAERGPAPPRVPFGLAVGVTGHRAEAMAESVDALIRLRLGEVLDALAAAAEAVAKKEADYFTPEKGRFILVSPLADGADQIAAEMALDRGFELQAILPFPRADYETDFSDAQALDRYRALLSRSSCIFELPGDRARPINAYVLAGRATIAHCDIVIAVWDGLPARGPGGTGEVVALALARGTPIIHISTDQRQAVSIVWSGFDPHVVTFERTAMAERPFSREALDILLPALLAPPKEPRERQYLRSYYGERERRFHFRLEYPLLLCLTGVTRFGRKGWRADPYLPSTHSEWSDFRQDCTQVHGVDASLDLLERAYGWSDRLAGHFAQSYRSGHAFNFLSAAVAVLLALTGLFLPGHKLQLAIAELAIILSVIANTHVGTVNGWHRRWLDYRELAERLRPMRSLKLLGVAAPDAPGEVTNPIPQRWIEWYAACIWRAMGCPVGAIRSGREASLAQALAAQELRPQIAYHRRSAEQVATFDRRLHVIGTSLFVATMVSCIVLITGYAVDPAWTETHAKLFVFLAAGQPALGSAIFGIQVQGDLAGTALRSQATAERLELLANGLEEQVGLSRSADLLEQAARTMLADLGEWRLAHEQHELVIPS